MHADSKTVDSKSKRKDAVQKTTHHTLTHVDKPASNVLSDSRSKRKDAVLETTPDLPVNKTASNAIFESRSKRKATMQDTTPIRHVNKTIPVATTDSRSKRKYAVRGTDRHTQSSVNKTATNTASDSRSIRVDTGPSNTTPDIRPKRIVTPDRHTLSHAFATDLATIYERPKKEKLLASKSKSKSSSSDVAIHTTQHAASDTSITDPPTIDEPPKKRARKAKSPVEPVEETNENAEHTELEDPDALAEVEVDVIEFEQGLAILHCLTEYPKAIPTVQRGPEMHSSAVVSILRELWRSYCDDEDYKFGTMVLSYRAQNNQYAILDSLQRHLVIMILLVESLKGVKKIYDMGRYKDRVLDSCSELSIPRAGEQIELFDDKGQPQKNAAQRWPRLKGMHSAILQFLEQQHMAATGKNTASTEERCKFINYILKKCRFDALVIRSKPGCEMNHEEQTRREGLLFILLNFTRDLPSPQCMTLDQPEDSKAVAWIEETLLDTAHRSNHRLATNQDTCFENVHWFVSCYARGKTLIQEARLLTTPSADHYRHVVSAICMHATEPELVYLTAIILGMLSTSNVFEKEFVCNVSRDIPVTHTVVKLLGLLQASVVLSMACTHFYDRKGFEHTHDNTSFLELLLLTLYEWWEDSEVVRRDDFDLLVLLYGEITRYLQRTFTQFDCLDMHSNPIVQMWSELQFLHCSHSLYKYTGMLSHSPIHVNRDPNLKPELYPYLYTHPRDEEDTPAILVDDPGCKSLLREVHDNTTDNRRRSAVECNWYGLSQSEGRAKMSTKIIEYLAAHIPETVIRESWKLTMVRPKCGGLERVVDKKVIRLTNGNTIHAAKESLRSYCQTFTEPYIRAPPLLPESSVTPAYCKRLANSVEKGIPFIGAFEVFALKDRRKANNVTTEQYMINGLVPFETAVALCYGKAKNLALRGDLNRVDPSRRRKLASYVKNINLDSDRMRAYKKDMVLRVARNPTQKTLYYDPKNESIKPYADTLSERTMLHVRVDEYAAATDAEYHAARAVMAGKVYRVLKQKEYFRPSDMYRARVPDGDADQFEVRVRQLPFLAAMCESLGTVSYNAFDLVLYVAAFMHFRYNNTPVFPKTLCDGVYTTVRKALLLKALPIYGRQVLDWLEFLQEKPEDDQRTRTDKLVIRMGSPHMLLIYVTVARAIRKSNLQENLVMAIHHTAFLSVLMGVQGLPEAHAYAAATKVAWVAAIIKKRMPLAEWSALFPTVACGLWCNDLTITTVPVTDILASLKLRTSMCTREPEALSSGGIATRQIQSIFEPANCNEEAAFDRLAHESHNFIKLLYLYDVSGVEILEPIFTNRVSYDGRNIPYTEIAAAGSVEYGRANLSKHRITR